MYNQYFQYHVVGLTVPLKYSHVLYLLKGEVNLMSVLKECVCLHDCLYDHVLFVRKG